jgi:sulfide dehydrogenase subunit beta
MSHRILRKKTLNPECFQIELEAPHVAERFKAGQFVIIRLHERSERIPLTVAGVDKQAGSIILIFQVVGKTTLELSTWGEGRRILNCVGPLGNPTEIKKFGRVVCVGGGTGIACIYPVVKAMSRAGNEVTTLIGARTASMLILENELREYSQDLLITTDDGSRGRKGFVTGLLEEVITEAEARQNRIPDLVVTIGPPLMMREAARVTKDKNIDTVASLNTVMVDGTGMCGCCRAYVDGQMKLACIDGPEFDAHKVDFDDVISRLQMFRNKEEKALQEFRSKTGMKHD